MGSVLTMTIFLTCSSSLTEVEIELMGLRSSSKSRLVCASAKSFRVVKGSKTPNVHVKCSGRKSE